MTQDLVRLRRMKAADTHAQLWSVLGVSLSIVAIIAIVLSGLGGQG